MMWCVSVQSLCWRVSRPFLSPSLSTLNSPQLSVEEDCSNSQTLPNCCAALPAFQPSAPAPHRFSLSQDSPAILSSHSQTFFTDTTAFISPEIHHPHLIPTFNSCLIESLDLFNSSVCPLVCMWVLPRFVAVSIFLVSQYLHICFVLGLCAQFVFVFSVFSLPSPPALCIYSPCRVCVCMCVCVARGMAGHTLSPPPLQQRHTSFQSTAITCSIKPGQASALAPRGSLSIVSASLKGTIMSDPGRH